MWTPVNLSAQPVPSSLKRADEASGHGSKHGDHAWTQPPGLQLTVDGVAGTAGENPTCHQQKVTLSHQYGRISQVRKPATW